MRPNAWETRPIRFHIALRIPPKPSCHSNPRLTNDQLPNLAAQGLSLIVYHVCSHAGQGTGKGARLQWRQNISHKNPAGDLSAAGIINDGQPSATHSMEKPQPRIRVPWLASRGELAQSRQVMP